ncbi:MAG TPA: hypothetical protein VGI81_06120 [Tepidisphaeraceae bacterium]|jgi:hypothetical protein
MINPDKHNQALHAIHRILTFTRKMALQGESTSRIAGVLDWAELLPRLLAAEQDKTDEFRNALAAIVEREPHFGDAVAAFDFPPGVRW